MTRPGRPTKNYAMAIEIVDLPIFQMIFQFTYGQFTAIFFGGFFGWNWLDHHFFGKMGEIMYKSCFSGTAAKF